MALANGLKWDYDISKIRVPYFAISSTGLFDAGNGKIDSGAPLSSMKENFDAIQNALINHVRPPKKY
ncbi:MAG: hypothetical protein Q4B82_09340 [Alysiella sp.]|uniref:hypothetical protein n=1 Tax=Alysiella sp. TaxID=1872483 RepID=UPI0026DABB49|nr:hypothetical protein [Alysiella sp.]MDO4434763.1 hypothetical protein [Alysiella sp.]